MRDNRLLIRWMRIAFSALCILLLIASATTLAGCPSGTTIPTDDGDDDDDDDTDDPNPDSNWRLLDDTTLDDDYDVADYTWNSGDVAYITLNGSTITENTDGATAVGSVLTITASGTYSITGSLVNGRIIVETGSDDEGVVRLIFNGINVTCLYSAPFYVANAERTAIILADGTTNVLTDPATYTYFDDADDEEPNAALHSRDYLTIGVPTSGAGTGQLTVNGNYNDGITGKDGLVINGGTITVNAEDDGIRGKDYLVVVDGDITVTTDEGDGFKSDKENNAAKGYVSIEGGSVTIDAEGDGIQAETYVMVYDGDLDVTTGGGAGTSFDYANESKKGLKGGIGVLIADGILAVDAADDAVHSNDFIEIDGGTLDLYSGDDGIHGDADVDIADGDIAIWESYEGVEGTTITVRDGSLYVESSDDGLNCADGSGGFDPVGTSSGDFCLNIYGGHIAVYAQGDGLDSNGDINMTAGTVLIHGPTSDNNGALDCGDSAGDAIVVDGGLLVAAGSSQMAEAPHSSSDQKYKLLKFSQKNGGTLCHIERSNGTDIVTFRPSKQYESIVVSSPDFTSGTYYVYFGGTYSGGTETNGLYQGGAYSGGTRDFSLTFSL